MNDQTNLSVANQTNMLHSNSMESINSNIQSNVNMQNYHRVSNSPSPNFQILRPRSARNNNNNTNNNITTINNNNNSLESGTNEPDGISVGFGTRMKNEMIGSVFHHHTRKSTRILIEKLQPSQLILEDEINYNGNNSGNLNGSGRNGMGSDGLNNIRTVKYTTWGMILIELDKFEDMVNDAKDLTKEEFIEIIKNLIDKTLNFGEQYVDHMSDGQFVLLTPVEVHVRDDETGMNYIANNDENYVVDKKLNRLQEIAFEILQRLEQEESLLEFCMGIALQDNAESDQKWFDVAKESLEDCKREREYARNYDGQDYDEYN